MCGGVAPLDRGWGGITREFPTLDLAGQALLVFAADVAAVDGLDLLLGGFVGAFAGVCPLLAVGSPQKKDSANPQFPPTPPHRLCGWDGWTGT